MFRISKKTEYGLRAMIIFAKNYKTGKISSVKNISEKEEISFDFLEKIISQLEKKKLLSSQKGILGGYFLAKNPNKITIKNIVNSLEGTGKMTNCSFCKKAKKCVAKSAWKKIDKTLSDVSQKITLKQLIK